MKLAFEILKATTKLEVGAKADIGADKLRALMLEVASDLHAAAEHAAPLWGELTGIIKKLEKGK